MFFNEFSSLAHDTGIKDRFSLCVKSRDWDTPASLAADAPVWAPFDRPLNAVLAPTRHPFNRLNGSQRLLTEILVVDLDKPLVHRAEDDRSLAAPAVRIAVRIVFQMNESV